MGLFDHFPYTNVHELNLDWLLTNTKQLMENMDALEEWKVTHEEQYNELKELVDKLYTGDWPPEFVSTLISWYQNNIVDIIGSMVKQVFFNIDDNGYFVAYIPDSWSDITFGTTGLDDFVTGYDYGHLTLTY